MGTAGMIVISDFGGAVWSGVIFTIGFLAGRAHMKAELKQLQIEVAALKKKIGL